MSMPWFKFYGQDFLTDPKIKRLNSLDQLAFIYMLCLGSQKEGRIEYLDEEALKGLMGLSPNLDEWSNLDDIFIRLGKLGMITIDNETVVITNYSKRQNSNLTGYERVKRFREKNKAKTSTNVINDNVHDNRDDNDRIDKIRIEENRIDKNINNNNIVISNEVAGNEVNKLLTLFKPLNPSYELLYKNSTQRASLQRLVDKHGAEKVAKMLEILPSIVSQPYAPKITTPYQLETKLGELTLFMEQKKNKTKTRSVDVEEGIAYLEGKKTSVDVD